MFDEAEILVESREILPNWVVWMPIVSRMLFALLAGAICFRLAHWIALRPYKRLTGGSWAERARLAYPARATSKLLIFLLPGILVGSPYILATGGSMYVNICPVSQKAIAICSAAVLLAYLLNARRKLFNQTLDEPVSLGYWLKSQLFYCLFFIPHVLVAVALAATLGDDFGGMSLFVFACGLVVFVFIIFGGGILLARWAGIAADASPRVSGIVEQCAQRIGLCPKAVYEFRWSMANAVAFPHLKSIGFSDRLVRDCTDNELEAICMHELGHLTESKRVQIARLVTPTVIVLLPVLRPLYGVFGSTGVIAVLIGLLVVLLANVKLARKMEERADELASDESENSADYASALENIYRLNGVPAVMPTNREVHPHLYDRIVAAGVEPDFPRPAPPSRARSMAAAGFSSVLAISLWLGFVYAPLYVVFAFPEESGSHAAIAVDGGNLAAFAMLAHFYNEADEDDSTIVAYRVLSIPRLEDWDAPATLAALYAEDGRCEEARRALAESRSRFASYDHSDSPATGEKRFRSVQEYLDYYCRDAVPVKPPN